MHPCDIFRKLASSIVTTALLSSMLMWRLGYAQDIPLVAIQVTPSQMKWEPFGTSIEKVVIVGDPNKPYCPGTILIKSAPHTKILPHALDQDRMATVITGTVYVGIGDTWDDSKLVKLTPGSYWVMPAGVSSFKKNDEETIYQLTVLHSNAPDCLSSNKMPEKNKK